MAVTVKTQREEMTLVRPPKRILLLVAALMIAACTGTTASPAGNAGASGVPTKLRVGIIPFQDFYPFQFAEQKGWFDEAGLDVEFVDFQFFPDATEGLAAGAVDLAPQEIGAVLPTVKNFPEIRFAVPVHIFDNGFALMTPPDSDLKTYDAFLLENGGDVAAAEKAAAAQLKGRDIVTTGNTDMELGVYAAAVKVGGLNWGSDIKITDLDPNQGLAAYLSGTGDLYIGGIPQRLRALQEGHQELITGEHLGPGSVPLVGFATTQKIYDEKRDALIRLFSVWNRTSRYAAESPQNTEELGVFIAQKLNEKTGAQMKASDFKTMFNGWQHFPPTVREWKNWYTRISPQERWDLASEFFVDVKKTVAEKPDYAQYILVDKFLNDYEAQFGADK